MEIARRLKGRSRKERRTNKRGLEEEVRGSGNKIKDSMWRERKRRLPRDHQRSLKSLNKERCKGYSGCYEMN